MNTSISMRRAGRGCAREAAHACAQRRAAVEAPRERGIVAFGHIAELASAPAHRDGIGIVRIVALARELERIAHAQLVRYVGRGVVAQPGER